MAYNFISAFGTHYLSAIELGGIAACIIIIFT